MQNLHLFYSLFAYIVLPHTTCIKFSRVFIVKNQKLYFRYLYYTNLNVSYIFLVSSILYDALLLRSSSDSDKSVKRKAKKRNLSIFWGLKLRVQRLWLFRRLWCCNESSWRLGEGIRKGLTKQTLLLDGNRVMFELSCEGGGSNLSQS